MVRRPKVVFALCAAVAAAAASLFTPAAHAQNWIDIATISSTLGNNAGYLCTGAGSTDLGCPTYAPTVDSSGLLTVGNVSATGGISVTGNISAAKFIGDGSGLTGVNTGTPDQIVSGTTSVTANTDGTISFTTGSVVTGYFDTAGRLIVPGVSVTEGYGISSTNGYFPGKIAIGGLYPTSSTVDILKTGAWGNSAATGHGLEIATGHSSSNYVLYMGADATSGLSYIQSERWNTGLAPLVLNAQGGYVGIATATPTTALEVNGTISATTFVGDGSGLTNLPAASADRITSGTTAVTANTDGTISFTTGSVVTGYFDGSGLLVAPGISLTTANGISSTNGYFSGNVGIGTSAPTTALEVSGTISATALYVNGVAITGSAATPTLAINDLTDAHSNTTNGTVFLGSGAGNAATGNTYNTATGINSMLYTTTGGYNTAFGYYSLVSNTTGSWNTAFGGKALMNATASWNTAFGGNALSANTTGSNNTAVGYNTLPANTTGTFNIAIGSSSLNANTTARYNIAVGNSSIITNVTGQYNTAFGGFTLNTASTVSNSVAIGYAAGTGSGSGNSITDDTFVGYESGYTVTTGNYNAYLGSKSGYGTTTGSNNTFMGYNAANNVTTGGNNIVIGSGIIPYSATGNYQLNIGNSIFGDMTNGNVNGGASKIGINTRSPNAELEVSGTISATTFVGDGSGLTGITTGASDKITSGTTSVTANNTGYISLTTGGSVTGYFDTLGNLIAPGISLTTTGISSTTGYFNGSVKSGAASLAPYAFIVSNSIANGSFGVSAGSSQFSDFALTGDSVLRANTYGNLILTARDSSGSVIFGTGSPDTEKMRLTSAGFVGIATATPTTALEVSGTISATALVVNGVSITGGGGAINDLSDAMADYTTTHNMYLGSGTGLAAATSATYNIAMGEGSLLSTGGGGYNIAIGYQTMVQNTTGSNNVALGYQALNKNTTGYHNDAIGYKALYSNTTGNDNMANGDQALYNNTSGSSNAALGYQTLRSNSTGNNNAGYGHQALHDNATGSNNTAIGESAFYYVNPASGSVALGYQAGMGVSGVSTFQNGTFVGANAGLAITTGSNNTFLGYSTGATTTTGGGNIAIGSGVNLAAAGTSYGLNIGNSIFGNMTNAASSGGAALIGINTTAPSTALEVSGTVSATHFVGDGSGLTGLGAGASDHIISNTASIYANSDGTISINTTWGSAYFTDYGNLVGQVGEFVLQGNTGTGNFGYGDSALASNTSGNNNTAMGYNALSSNDTGSDNTAVGGFAGSGYWAGSQTHGSYNTSLGYQAGNQITGNNNTLLGYNAATSLVAGNNNIAIGSGADIASGSSNLLNIGNTIYGNLSSKMIGINVTSPSYSLQASGQVAGGGAYVNTSDRRLKKDISPIAYGLNTVMQLEPVGFNWKDQSVEWKKQHQLGLIAQDVQKLVPEVVTTANDTSRTLSIAYGELVPVLIKATQELDHKNQALQAENDTLKASLKATNTRLDTMQKQLDGLLKTRR